MVSMDLKYSVCMYKDILNCLCHLQRDYKIKIGALHKEDVCVMIHYNKVNYQTFPSCMGMQSIDWLNRVLCRIGKVLMVEDAMNVK